MQNRKKLENISQFASEAAAAKGGTPMVAHAKIDTKKGWLPFGLTDWGKKNIGSLEDAQELVGELDAGAVGARRGEIWKALHKGTGSWRNQDLSTTLKPTNYTPAR